MDLVDTLPHVRYWYKILNCSIPNPHLLTDLEVKVTYLDVLIIDEDIISFKCKHIRGSACIPGGQNIEHPHALAFFFFFLAHLSRQAHKVSL